MEGITGTYMDDNSLKLPAFFKAVEFLGIVL